MNFNAVGDKIESIANKAVDGVRKVGEDAVKGVENAGKRAIDGIMDIPVIKWLRAVSDWWETKVMPTLRKLGKYAKTLGKVLCVVLIIVLLYNIVMPIAWVSRGVSWLVGNVVTAWKRAISRTSAAASNAGTVLAANVPKLQNLGSVAS